jgi:hypothetical protein
MLSYLRRATAWSPASAALLFLALNGCGGGGSDPSVPTNITLNPASLSFTALGQTQQISFTVTDQNGDPLSDVSITWSSSDAEVASVTSSGLVTAVRSGSAQVTATAGSATAVAQVSVTQTPTQVQRSSGDAQTAVAGQSVPILPAVLVLDANNNPVAGVPVSFEIVSGRGEITNASTVTDANGLARVGSWRLGSKGANVLRATVAGTEITGNPVTFTATGTSSFNIVLRFEGNSTPTQLQAFAEAQTFWESLVIADLQDVLLSAAPGDCGPDSPRLNQTVDDLLILVSVGRIDGPGNVIGSAGPCFIRVSNNLPVLGAMILDSRDLEDIEAEGLLSTLILHEMGHVLGFGSLWPFQGLLADASLPPNNGTDPHFIGAQAIAAFNAVGGAAYTGAKVPVENTGGEGTADGHWRESVFGNELMTGFVNLEQNPLSIVTVSSLADQGYAVNRVGVDPFSLTLAFRRSASRAPLKLGNDLLRLPIRTVDAGGRVIRLFRH